MEIKFISFFVCNRSLYDAALPIICVKSNKKTNFDWFLCIFTLDKRTLSVYNGYSEKLVNETFLIYCVFTWRINFSRPPVADTFKAEVHAAKHPILGTRTCNTVLRAGHQNPRPYGATVRADGNQGTDLRTRKPMIRLISFSPSDRASLELICLPLRAYPPFSARSNGKSYIKTSGDVRRRRRLFFVTKSFALAHAQAFSWQWRP